jgi:hypothetical protein
MSNLRHRLTGTERWRIREVVLTNMARGNSISTVADAIAAEYKVKASAVVRDWQRRDTWLSQILDLTKAEQLLAQLLAEMQESRREAWELEKLSKKQENYNAAVGALKHISESVSNQVQVLQSLGKLAQAPTSLKIEGKMELDLNAVLKQYESNVRDAAKRNTEAAAAAEQVDSTQADKQAS